MAGALRLRRILLSPPGSGSRSKGPFSVERVSTSVTNLATPPSSLAVRREPAESAQPAEGVRRPDAQPDVGTGDLAEPFFVGGEHDAAAPDARAQFEVDTEPGGVIHGKIQLDTGGQAGEP